MFTMRHALHPTACLHHSLPPLLRTFLLDSSQRRKFFSSSTFSLPVQLLLFRSRSTTRPTGTCTATVYSSTSRRSTTTTRRSGSLPCSSPFVNTAGMSRLRYRSSNLPSFPFPLSTTTSCAYTVQVQQQQQQQQQRRSVSCGDLIGKDIGHTDASILSYLQELAYRSAYARERLREKILEAGVEPALRQLRQFCSVYQFTPDEKKKILAATDVERLEILFDAFEKWFFATRAPKVVQMHEPWNWYPKARQMRRKFIFHCGPTNSGKTHEALEKLMAAKSGVYCAPLKALAAQVWKKIDAKVPCDLLIGDERQFGGSAEHVSCTMEMTPVDYGVDVGVIDEIQMLEDRDRGWAWTRALLGLPAREIHLCGEARALQIIRKLLWETREAGNLFVQPHKRLVPLAISRSLNGSYRNVEAGDCIVTFSRKAIFSIKRKIEEELPEAQVFMIYGGLPFDVREAQSDGFNDAVIRYQQRQQKQKQNGVTQVQQEEKIEKEETGEGIPVLVTTDAIAYGLNMNIRRIVFSTTRKFDGKGMISLPLTTTLQVAGRAGRYGLEFSKMGFATTLFPNDLQKVENAFETKLDPIKKCGLLPSADILCIYAELHKDLSFPDLMKKFVEEASVSQLFFACDMTRSLLKIATEIGNIPNFLLRDKILFCYAPLSDSSQKSYEYLRLYATMHANNGPVELFLDEDIRRIEKDMFAQEHNGGTSNVHGGADLFSSMHATLQELEWVYRMTEVYCWLAWRFMRTFHYLEDGKVLKKKTVNLIKRQLALIDEYDRAFNSSSSSANFTSLKERQGQRRDAFSRSDTGRQGERKWKDTGKDNFSSSSSSPPKVIVDVNAVSETDITNQALRSNPNTNSTRNSHSSFSQQSQQQPFADFSSQSQQKGSFSSVSSSKNYSSKHQPQQQQQKYSNHQGQRNSPSGNNADGRTTTNNKNYSNQNRGNYRQRW